MIWVGPVGKTLLLRITWADRGSREGLCQYLPTFYWSFIFILREIVNELRERKSRKKGRKSEQTIEGKKEVNIQMDDKRKAKKRGNCIFCSMKKLFFFGAARSAGDKVKWGQRTYVPLGMHQSIGKGHAAFVRSSSIQMEWRDRGLQRSRMIM